MAATKEKRQYNVDQTNASTRLSGFDLDNDMLELQRRYIEGEITIQDMLDWCTALSRKFQRQEGREIVIPKDAH